MADDPLFRELGRSFAEPEVVEHFAFTWLHQFQHLKKSVTAATFWENSQVTQPLQDALGRLQRFCNCILHLLCSDFPEGHPGGTDDEVMSIVHFKGSTVLESGLRRLLTDSKSAWAAEVNDLVKTGGSSVLASSKVSNLEGLLAMSAPTGSQICEMIKLMRETQSAVRSKKLKAIRESFASKLKKMAIMLRGQASEFDANVKTWLSSQAIDAILDGLSLVHDLPGCLDQRKEVAEFRTQQIKKIASNDLKITLEASHEHGIDFALLQACLNHYGSGREDDAGMLDMEVTLLCPCFVENALRHIMDKATLVRLYLDTA